MSWIVAVCVNEGEVEVMELPDALHYQLEGLAQREIVELELKPEVIEKVRQGIKKKRKGA